MASAGLAWGMLMVASVARSGSWTLAGMKINVGNRDDVPEPSPFAARADRAAKNMLENLVLFAALLLAASLAKVPSSDLSAPCALFVYSRMVYALIYWLGIKYVRTAVWSIGAAALIWIASLVAQAKSGVN
jgi:uncharacterized MAPEG superfamily protein